MITALFTEFPLSLLLTAVLDAALIAAFLVYQRPGRQPDPERVKQLEALLDQERQNRHDDRTGRIRAERLLRERLQTTTTSSDGIAIRPIGYIRSVFRDRRGTPRQSLLAAHARSELHLELFVQAQSSLSGLDEFSHVWLIGVFHENTDTIRSLQGRFKTKIAPPRLNGAKRGVFATRSPHRPNPIALSIGRIVSIDSNRVVLSGVDLIDGTPILDIKPYVGRYDALEGTSCPEWIRCDFAQGQPPLKVQYAAAAEARLTALAGALEFYDDADAVRVLIDEVLRNDIRSLHQRVASPTPGAIYIVRLDRLLIRYSLQEDDIVLIQDIEYEDGPAPAS